MLKGTENLSQYECICQREHTFTSEVISGDGAVLKLPGILAARSIGNVFVFADKNTFAAAGERVCALLEEAGIRTRTFVFDADRLEPNDKNVGIAIMNFDKDCDAVLSVGSGVLNDLGKIVANVSEKPYIIVCTAPSMDGYASASSSMTVDGLKTSVKSKCPDIILADTDILCSAPTKMMLSGLGDMLAKYVSICDWRIAHLVTGEYYCEDVADLVRQSLKRCIDNADGLLRRDRDAVNAVTEGLILCGAAMKFAGVSRPASGIEHYFSHIFDMRAEEFGTPCDFHGIQCAIGTLLSVKLYEKLKNFTPDRKKAMDFVKAFDVRAYHQSLVKLLGRGAENMIKLEEKERKYDREKHEKRLDIILRNWDKILGIINEELPPAAELEDLMDRLGMPKTPDEIGIDGGICKAAFDATRDIRDKYVLSRLCWDLGIENIFDLP